MSLEPNARRRLHLVFATTRDPALAKELRQVFEDDPMAFAPSADLLRAIALCAACTQDASRDSRAGLCDEHREQWNLEVCTNDVVDGAEQSSLQRLVHEVFTTADGGAELLSAFDRQRRALTLVLEAHARGAVRLPESIARTVERACTSGPRFLTGGSRSAVQQAS